MRYDGHQKFGKSRIPDETGQARQAMETAAASASGRSATGASASDNEHGNGGGGNRTRVPKPKSTIKPPIQANAQRRAQHHLRPKVFQAPIPGTCPRSTTLN